ncbi:MAG: hypothetical protein NUV46_00610 [Nanoarchaeota archaeon]|nr:hypothetical protein [Nanoarchaeota archaeon]
MVNNEISLLQKLCSYAKNKNRPRGGWYIQAVEDCITTISEGNFDSIMKRDAEYDAELKRLAKKTHKKKGK